MTNEHQRTNGQKFVKLLPLLIHLLGLAGVWGAIQYKTENTKERVEELEKSDRDQDKKIERLMTIAEMIPEMRQDIKRLMEKRHR